MSRRKSDAALTALAIGGTILTLGGLRFFEFHCPDNLFQNIF